MVVEEYGFGRMRAFGKTFDADLILFSDGGVVERWWRKEGHAVCMEDLREAFAWRPEILVIGTGYYGMVKVPDEVVKAFKSIGAEVVAQPTTQAWKTFNDFCRAGKRAAGAFHLTC